MRRSGRSSQRSRDEIQKWTVLIPDIPGYNKTSIFILYILHKSRYFTCQYGFVNRQKASVLPNLNLVSITRGTIPELSTLMTIVTLITQFYLTLYLTLYFSRIAPDSRSTPGVRGLRARLAIQLLLLLLILQCLLAILQCLERCRDSKALHERDCMRLSQSIMHNEE
jgi:hypothetical protein